MKPLSWSEKYRKSAGFFLSFFGGTLTASIAYFNMGIGYGFDQVVIFDVIAPFIFGSAAFFAITYFILKNRQMYLDRSRAEARLEDAIRSLPVSFTLYDTEERLVLTNRRNDIWMNHRAADVPGGHIEDIIRSYISDRQLPEAVGREEEYLAERLVHFRNPSASPIEIRYADGTIVEAKFYQTTDGETVGIRRDITERKRIEQALHQSDERYHRTVAGSNDGLWEWNIQTDEDYFSPRWKDILGYEPHELGSERQEFLKLLHPDDIDRYEQNLKKHLTERSPHDINFRLRHRQGHFIWVRSRAQTFRDENDTPTYTNLHK